MTSALFRPFWYTTSFWISIATLVVHALWLLGSRVVLRVTTSNTTHVTQGNSSFLFLFPLSTYVTILLHYPEAKDLTLKKYPTLHIKQPDIWGGRDQNLS